MDNLYLVIYSKMDTDERKQGVCKLNRLKALLERQKIYCMAGYMGES